MLQRVLHLVHLTEKGDLLSLSLFQEDGPLFKGGRCRASPPSLSVLQHAYGLSNVIRNRSGSTVGFEELLPKHGNFAIPVGTNGPPGRTGLGRWI